MLYICPPDPAPVQTYWGLLNAEEDSGRLDYIQGTGIAPWDLSGLHAKSKQELENN